MELTHRNGIRQFIFDHWPVLFALAFTAYSAFMVDGAIDLRRRMRAEADAYLLSDSLRRANAADDVLLALRDQTEGHGNLHEIHAYLTNRDLGMSMRYGLSASVEQVRLRLEERAESAARRWGVRAFRIAYVDESGKVLADTAPGQAGFMPTIPDQGKTNIRIEPEKSRLIAYAPVTFRGRPEGYILISCPLDVLFRNMLPVTSGVRREWLETRDGRPLPGQAGIGTDFVAGSPGGISGLADNVVTSLDMHLQGKDTGRLSDRVLAVKTPLSAASLAFVTVVAEDRAYGHLTSDKTLLSAAVLPLLLLAGALVLHRQRIHAGKLQAKATVAEQERLRAEIRSQELASEIARRKALEQSLTESEARWQFALEGARDGVWDWNVDTNALYVSRQWQTIRGIAAEEISGRLTDWSDNVHPDDLPGAYAGVERCLRGETPYYEAEYRIRHRDGSYRWVLDRGMVVARSADGRPLRMIGTNSDITGRKRMEMDIEEERQRLATTLALSPDGFVFVGEDDRVSYVNPAAESLLGMAAARIVGTPWPAFAEGALVGGCARIAQCQWDMDAQACDRWLLDHGELRCRVMRRAGPPGGRESMLQLSLSGLGKGLRSRVLCLRDVTRETEVDRMKSEFLSTAAHELRSPMASILGFIELLLHREFAAEKRQELLGIVHQQATGLTQMLNELLDLARIEARAGKAFNLAGLDLCELARRRVAGLLVPGDPRQVALSLPAEPVWVRADAEKLGQALTNVLSNAYKFSPEGGPIELELVREVRNGAAWAGVRVRDRGIGMRPEEMARVWERFYRADRSGHIPGTGLGMSLVKEIMEIHGGRAEIASECDKGTAVTLWLAELAEAP